MTDADAALIAELQKRIAALEAPPPSGFGATINSALTSLGKPDSAVMASVRHGLSVAGAGLATHGYANSSAVDQLVGAAMALVGVVWSIMSKYIATKWLEVAVKAPASTTPTELAAIVAATPAGPVTAEKVDTAVAQTKGGTEPPAVPTP